VIDVSAIEIRIGSHLRVELASLSESAKREIQRSFRHSNPAYHKAKRMGFAAMNEPRFYDSYRFDLTRGEAVFWRGTARRLRALLEDHGHTIRWIDQRLVLPPTGLSLGNLVLQPEQDPAVRNLLKFQQGILRGGTGSGKTEMLLAAIVGCQQPALVQVWNKGLLEQWVERIVKWKILPEHKIGIIQGSRNKIGPITIGMIQSLYKRTEEWHGRFGAVITDECQRTPATTFTKAVNDAPAKYRWGASADVVRKDRKEFLGYEVFGYQEFEEKGMSIKYFPIAEVQGRGQAMEPTIIIVPTHYQDPQYEDDRNYGQLINRLVVNEARNELIARHLSRELRKGRQVILFSERVDSAQYWVNYVSSLGIKAGPLIGGTDYQAETMATLKSLRAGDCRFAATTTFADVGLDVPSLDCAFITCPTAGNIKRMGQQVGRVVRPLEGKRSPIAYYFWDKHVLGISKGMRNVKKQWKNVLQLDN